MAINNILRSTRLLCKLFLIIVLSGTCQADSNNHFPNVSKWEVFEINLTTTNTYSNPYLDVLLNTTFYGPNNKRINLDGFWDGGDNWKIRVAPTEIGMWSYSTYSNDAQLNGKKGSFYVVDSDKKGFIKVSPTYPHTFMYDDGTPFFFLGDTAWGINQRKLLPFDGTYQNYIDVRESQGFTVIQATLSPEAAYTADGNHGSEGGYGFTDWTFTIINPAYFQWLDKRFYYATVDKNMVIEFWLEWSSVWNKGLSDTKYKNYAKYIMARYSAYNIIVGVIGEYEEVNNVTGIRSAGQYIQTVNPYNHPITTHTLDTTADDFGNDSWISYHGQQQKTLTPTQFNSNIIRDRVYGKPVVQMEVCYETQIREYGCTDLNEYRKSGWSVLTGGGFYSYGHNNIIGNLKKDWNNLYSSGALEMGYLKKFWDKIKWWEMIPNNSIVTSGFAIANNGKEYVVYLPVGGSTTINLPSVNFSVKWYNPRTGTYQGKTTVKGGSSRTFKAPDSNDWVLHINTTSGVSTPAPSTNKLKAFFLKLWKKLVMSN